MPNPAPRVFGLSPWSEQRDQASSELMPHPSSPFEFEHVEAPEFVRVPGRLVHFAGADPSAGERPGRKRRPKHRRSSTRSRQNPCNQIRASWSHAAIAKSKFLSAVS
jgi:hypothetical protein